jgi:hypothetical protein
MRSDASICLRKLVHIDTYFDFPPNAGETEPPHLGAECRVCCVALRPLLAALN